MLRQTKNRPIAAAASARWSFASWTSTLADEAPLYDSAADVLLRLGRLEQALELVERTSALSDRRIQPWSDLAAAVLLSELGRDAAIKERDILRPRGSRRAGRPAINSSRLHRIEKMTVGVPLPRAQGSASRGIAGVILDGGVRLGHHGAHHTSPELVQRCSI